MKTSSKALNPYGLFTSGAAHYAGRILNELGARASIKEANLSDN